MKVTLGEPYLLTNKFHFFFVGARGVGTAFFSMSPQSSPKVFADHSPGQGLGMSQIEYDVRCSGLLPIELKNLPLIWEDAVNNKLKHYQTKFNSPIPSENECQHVLLIETKIQLECFLISF